MPPPILASAQHLTSQGHRVIVLTGSRFADAAQSAGAEPVALLGRADFDERDLDSYIPGADQLQGLALSRYQLSQTFIAPMPKQWQGVKEILRSQSVDAILVDNFFLGVLPLLLGPRSERPPVLALGVGPLAQSSRNAPPAAMGFEASWSRLGVARNRVLNLAARQAMRPLQKEATGLLRDLSVPEPAGGVPFIMDIAGLFDRYLHLGPREFEYPLEDLLPNVRFVGPMDAGLGLTAAPLPDWWHELDQTRPIVHVTQGTVANNDFEELIRPAMEALSGLDVQVVISTGGQPVEAVGDLPDNCHIARLIPYDRLLPRTDLLVANGGYGTVMLGLRHGIPAVVAPGGEDKPEVAARVAYHHTGINLRTAKPTVSQLKTAVHTVLADPSYRLAAQQVAIALCDYHALDGIAAELEQAMTTAPAADGQRKGVASSGTAIRSRPRNQQTAAAINASTPAPKNTV